MSALSLSRGHLLVCFEADKPLLFALEKEENGNVRLVHPKHDATAGTSGLVLESGDEEVGCAAFDDQGRYY